MMPGASPAGVEGIVDGVPNPVDRVRNIIGRISDSIFSVLVFSFRDCGYSIGADASPALGGWRMRNPLFERTKLHTP